VEEEFKDQSFKLVPSLFWFAESLNPIIITFLPFLEKFDACENLFHLLCIFNIVLSSLILFETKTRYFTNWIGFIVLWYSYYSIMIVGRIFTSFQWDTLLLETG
jgi:hypothetical protein